MKRVHQHFWNQGIAMEARIVDCGSWRIESEGSFCTTNRLSGRDFPSIPSSGKFYSSVQEPILSKFVVDASRSNPEKTGGLRLIALRLSKGLF
jgi:hypothetical protein